MEPTAIVVDGEQLTLDDVRAVAQGRQVQLHPMAITRLQRAAAACQKSVVDGTTHYGINTGFGPFARKRIPKADIEALQINLLRSHASGFGQALPVPIVRAMLVMRAQSLAVGYSGVGPPLVQALLNLLNKNITPCIPEKGSVGASGDLAPLAHMALVLMGEGEVFVDDKRMATSRAFACTGITPHVLQPKEGLALINGTQYMTAFGVQATGEAQTILNTAQVAAAMSIESLLGSTRAFDADLHRLRRHRGQQAVAANLRRLLQESAIVASHEGCGRVQDAYSLRCTPQILGASQDAIRHAESVLVDEVNAVTDNPLIFPEDGRVVSGGNFHGQPVAMVLDYLYSAVAEVGSVSERRLYNLLYTRLSASQVAGDETPRSGDVDELPYCLVKKPGLQSGFMIAQYTAAALVSENRTLGHPAILDNVMTGGGIEDHNSMGSIAALRLPRLLENVRGVVAVELMAAAQALEFRAPLDPAPATRAALRVVRQHVDALVEDRSLTSDIQSLSRLAVFEEILAAVEQTCGAFETN